jgi:hypothetical protein
VKGMRFRRERFESEKGREPRRACMSPDIGARCGLKA